LRPCFYPFHFIREKVEIVKRKRKIHQLLCKLLKRVYTKYATLFSLFTLFSQIIIYFSLFTNWLVSITPDGKKS
jgi:hypothetical protein